MRSLAGLVLAAAVSFVLIVCVVRIHVQRAADIARAARRS